MSSSALIASIIKARQATRSRSHAVSVGNASGSAALNSARRAARSHAFSKMRSAARKKRMARVERKLKLLAAGARKRVANRKANAELKRVSPKKNASPKRNSPVKKKPSSRMMQAFVRYLAASASLAPLMKMRVGSRYPSAKNLQIVNAHPVRAARAVIPSASLAVIPGASVRNTPVYSLKGLKINNKVPSATLRSQAYNQMGRNLKKTARALIFRK